MFNHSSGYSLSDIAAVSGNNNGRNSGGAFGDDWAWIVILLLLGWGRNGFGGFGGDNGGSGNGGYPCATQPDIRAAVDQQTLLSKLDQQTYGIADSVYALNSAIMNGFHGVDNAVCTLGYQTQSGFNTLGHQISDCCCDIRGAIKDVGTQSLMNTNAIQQQIASCCCDIEKMNMQNRFDAQSYNCNTLQAIDKLGDRILDFMTQDKIASLTAENQSLKFAASQAAQNAFITANQQAQTAEIVRRLETPCPIPAYVVPNPNCCYTATYSTGCGNCNSNLF